MTGGIIGRLLRGLWRALDGLRKVLHLLLLLALFMIFLAGVAIDRPPLPESAALVLDPEGTIVDQLSGDPLERALARARGIPLQETLLKDLISAVRDARDDGRIRALVLDLDGLTGAGLSKLQELGDELLRFKESGKPVIALGDGFTRNQYYLAAYADEIYMHPMGFVYIDGYSRYLPYFRTALENLSVDYHVWTVGEYKSFVEPVTRDDMSPEDREASEAFLGALWASYQADVSAARQLAPDALQRYADDAVALLADAGGDAAQLALDFGLVDALLTRDVQRERLRELVGPDRRNGQDYAQVSYRDYLRARRDDAGAAPSAKVAVVVAAGAILDGEQPPGTVGGDSTARLIRRAAADEQVRALVLRVDSPGGSAFASDIILRELEVFRQSERPVVVSMGSVAASGGYWISLAGDEIWASPTTLTGSIGVGAMFPTIPRTLDRLGINVDGVGTTRLAGQLDPTRALGPDAAQLLQQTIEHAYQQFIGKVATHRERPVAEVDRVARGRVWIGSAAREHGLVDRLGNLDDAIRSAAELAGLEEGGYRVEYVEQDLGFAQRLALQYAQVLTPLLRALGMELPLSPAITRLLEAAGPTFALLERMNDPRGIYAYCHCDVR